VKRSIEEFVSSINNLLTIKLNDFMIKYKNLLPNYAIIHLHSKLADVFSQIKDGKEVMVVVDNEGNVRGILTPMDILVMLRSEGKGIIRTHFGTTYALRSKKLPPKSLLKLDVVSIMDKHPLVLEDDLDLVEAIERMSTERTNYAVVVNSRGKVLGVISSTSIIRVIAEMGKSVFESL